MRAASKNTPNRLSFAKVYESPAFIRAIPPGLQSRQTSKLIMKPINKQYVEYISPYGTITSVPVSAGKRSNQDTQKIT